MKIVIHNLLVPELNERCCLRNYIAKPRLHVVSDHLEAEQDSFFWKILWPAKAEVKSLRGRGFESHFNHQDKGVILIINDCCGWVLIYLVDLWRQTF